MIKLPYDPSEIAKINYETYAAMMNFENAQGKLMPKFEDLSEQERKAWRQAAETIFSIAACRGNKVGSDWE